MLGFAGSISLGVTLTGYDKLRRGAITLCRTGGKPLACCTCKAHNSSCRCAAAPCFLGRFLPKLGGAKSSAVLLFQASMEVKLNRQDQLITFFIYVAQMQPAHDVSYTTAPSIHVV